MGRTRSGVESSTQMGLFDLSDQIADYYTTGKPLDSERTRNALGAGLLLAQSSFQAGSLAVSLPIIDTLEPIGSVLAGVPLKLALAVVAVLSCDQVEQLRERTERINTLLTLLTSPQPERDWPQLVVQLAQGVQERRRLRRLFAHHYSLLARKVTERSAETGEHYITRSRADYRDMLGDAELAAGLAEAAELVARAKPDGATLLGVGNADGSDTSDRVHDTEVFGPVATLVPYRTTDNSIAHAVALVRRGQGSLVCSLYGSNPGALAEAAAELASSHGRVLR